MKKIALPVLLALAACGSPQLPDPASEPVPPGFQLLGTFDGEVNSAKGIFSVRMRPNEAGTAAGMRSVKITPGVSTVSIANDGTCPEAPNCTWNNAVRVECGGERGTGGYVKITSNYPAASVPGALYARITAVSSPGVVPCNSSLAPSGMTDLAGLWEYGTIPYSDPPIPVSAAWSFYNSSTASFQFTGAIYGIVATEDIEPTPGANVTTVGALVAYGQQRTNTIVTQNSSFQVSTVAAGGGNLGAHISGVAGDSANSRVWYVTTSGTDGLFPSYAGFVGSDLTGDTYATVTAATSTVNSFRTIAVDPHTTRAFFINFVSATPAYKLKSVSASGSPLVASVDGTDLTMPAQPLSMAIDTATTAVTGKRIFLVNNGAVGSSGSMWRVDSTNPTGYTTITMPTGTSNPASVRDCRRPRVIINIVPGVFHFGTESGAICTVSNAGTGMARVANLGLGAISGLAADLNYATNGYIWFTTMDGWIGRYSAEDFANGITYTVAAPEATPQGLGATTDGLFWSTLWDVAGTGDAVAIVRIEP